MKVRHSIGSSTGSGLAGVVSLEGIRMTVLTTSWLGHVRYNLHTTWDCSSRTAAPGGVSRGCWTSKALCKLLHKSHSNIVCCDVNSISDTKDD
jgi:hypothetical protein